MVTEERAAPARDRLPLAGQRRVDGHRVGRRGVDAHQVDGEEDGADGHQDVGGDLHAAARHERKRGHHERPEAERDHERLVGD